MIATTASEGDVDVAIIGGGPAGTTIGTHLARRGYKVVVLEKDTHPRFHIGESLLPSNLPILQRLGVLEQVRAMGVKKLGADFTASPRPNRHRTYHFSRALGDTADHAFEVTRSQFDRALFENCRLAGVDVRQNHRATAISPSADGRQHIAYFDADGSSASLVSRFVVDASGRDALLATSRGWRQRNRKHASAAIFSHFHGVSRRRGADAGNISVYWFPHGWLWMIPLSDDVMSIGAVCWPEYLAQRGSDTEAFLMRTLALCPAAARRMRRAKRAAPVRITGNYSYRSKHLCGDGYLLLGDAYAFIDPVFSSGVYLAMHSAEQAVEMVTAWLAGDRRAYRRHARIYRRLIARGLTTFSWFIYRFTSPAMRWLFDNPRNIWQVEQAVVSMLAGDVFRPGPARRRLILFRLLYRMSFILSLKSSWVAWRWRRRNARMQLADGA